MLTVSDKAMNLAMNKLLSSLMSRPELFRRMGGQGKTSNQEFLDLIGSTFSIGDPLILEVHRRLLESLQQPALLETEILSGSQLVIHLWYGALRIEEELTGQLVPRLRRERLEELLPSYYIPPGTKMTIEMRKEEYSAIEKFMTPIYMIFKETDFQSVAVAFVYPLVVLTRLLNDAATPSQS